MVRKCKGRQKIEMKKMKNETNLQVTFSKRRFGLFKKASELCTLCSAEIAIIVHSPGGKVFSFGHPNVDNVTDRFLRPHHHQHNIMQFSEANRNTVVQNLNDHLNEVTSEFEAEKKRNGDLKQKRKDSKIPGMWWEDPVETLDLSQLTKLKCVLESVKKTVANETSRYLRETAPHNFYAGSSSNAAAFGISAATNIKTELDMFNHGRMVSMNTFNHNHNMIVPYNHATPAGNNGNNTEGFVPQRNMIVPYNHATQAGNNGINTEGLVPQRNMIVPYHTPPFGNSGNNAEGFVPNHNMIVPHHMSPFGNSGNNDEGFVSQHNMNYMTEFNQNQIQYFKQDGSEYAAFDPRHSGRN